MSQKNLNLPCDEICLVAIRRLRVACRQLIDCHDQEDERGDCFICEAVMCLMYLLEQFEATFDSNLYRTPVVKGELSLAEELAILQPAIGCSPN